MRQRCRQADKQGCHKGDAEASCAIAFHCRVLQKAETVAV
jgi:hypothetical protein